MYTPPRGEASRLVGRGERAGGICLRAGGGIGGALIKAVIFDVDGTLADSNDLHAEA